MATYDSHVVKGWRSRMADEAAELRKRIWQAPAQAIYCEDRTTPSKRNPKGHLSCFLREFGGERKLAQTELKRLREIQSQIARSEVTDDQREAENAIRRKRRAAQSEEWHAQQRAVHRARYAAQPDEWHARRAEQRRARLASKDEEWHAKQRERRRVRDAALPKEWRARKRALQKAWYAALSDTGRAQQRERVEVWRASQSDEWREQRREKNRAWYAAQSEAWHEERRKQNRERNRKHREDHKDAINASRRAAYARAPEAARAKKNALMSIKRECDRSANITETPISEP